MLTLHEYNATTTHRKSRFDEKQHLVWRHEI